MTDATVQEAPSPAQASLWEDFIDIFYAPRQVFERRREAGFGLVLLIITVIGTALFFASQGPLEAAYAAEFRRSLESAGAAAQPTPEQMEQGRQAARIFGTLGILIGYPVSVLIVGVVLWALGKLFSFSGTVKMAILIVTYAQIPRILQGVATLIQGLLLRPDSLADVSLGPARFLDPDSTSMLVTGLLGRLDVFYIWSTILIAIGAQVLGRVPRVQSYVLAVLVWVVGALPSLMGALAGGRG